MNWKVKKRINGAISLMLVAILLPTMLLSGLMVDLSRYSMAKAMISSAGDLTLNAALADYDGILQDVYGLFAVSQDDEDLYHNLTKYFADTLVSNGVVSEGESEDYVRTLLDSIAQYLYVGESGEAKITNLFDMEIAPTVAVEGVENSTLENDQVLKKQIVEYMKYRAPMNCALSFFSGLNALGKSGEQADVIQTKLDAETYTSTVSIDAKALWEAIKKYDKELYSAKSFEKEYNDERVTDEKVDKNDTEFLGNWVNEEIKGEKEQGVYNYQLVNKYILGFLLDDMQEDITGGGSMATSSAGSGKISNGEDTLAAVEKLKSAAEEFKGKRTEIESSKAEYEKVLEDSRSLMLNTVTPGGDVKAEVRTDFDSAVKTYKSCFRFLQKANQMTSVERRMISEFQEFLKAKNVMDKTYSAALDLKEKLENRLDEIAGEIEECNSDIGDWKDEIKELNGKENSGKKIEELNEKIAAAEAKITELTADGEKIKSELPQLESAIGEVESKMEPASYDGGSRSFSPLEIQKTIATAIENMNQLYKRYDSYRTEANIYADNLVKGIYKESWYIYDKTEKLQKDLTEIVSLAGILLNSVDEYNRRLDAWDSQNKSYQNSNNSEEDGFGTSNAQEIKDRKERYNREEIIEIREYAQKQLSNLIPFWNYIQGAGSEGYHYGNNWFWQLDGVNGAINAVQSKATDFKNKEVVSTSECNEKFKTLCKEQSFNYNYTETKTHVGSFTREDFQDDPKRKETLLPFVGYLMCTYPESTETKEENTTVTVTSTEGEKKEDALSLYNTMKDSLKNGEGKDPSDSEVKEKYGYTYKGRETPGNDDKEKKVTTTANADDASGAYAAQKSASSNILSNIKNALTEGRDNVYVMEYIFGNFSYNTMVQDGAYKDYKEDKSKFYAASLAKEIEYQPYMALTIEEKAKGEEDEYASTRPATLSGYPIAEYNNEFYGAEVEYLLYGFKSAENNVAAADASIFAIRFILNSVYAFTNSEIRNTTRTAGLAVQAASLGVVPYQAVMVVLQLALSMSESLLDLSVMHTGAKVAIVPTNKTWMLSPTNAGNLLKDVAAAKAKDVAKEATNAALDRMNAGIQNFVDASADEMGDNITGLITGMESSAGAKATELMDQAFARVEETMMAELNKLQYLDADVSPQDALNEVFAAARQSKNEAINSMQNAGGEVGVMIMQIVNTQLDGVINEMQSEANLTLSTLMGENAGKSLAAYVTTLCNMLQSKISEKIDNVLNYTSKVVQDKAIQMVDGVKTEVKELANEKTEDAKKKIIEKTNDFIDSKVNTITDKMPDLSGLADNGQNINGAGAASRALYFGYSDYLRVFLFVGLCSGQSAILNRTAKLIESNINYPNTRASEEAEKGENQGFFSEMFERITWFFTKKKSGNDSGTVAAESDKWKVSKAYTYVKLDADINMDMFFLNTEFFSSVINQAYMETGGEAPSLSDTTSTFHYHSVMGY